MRFYESEFWTKNRLSPTVRIANAIAQDMFMPVYSTEMISEYREVLSRTKFDFSVAEVNVLRKLALQREAGDAEGKQTRSVNKISSARSDLVDGIFFTL